MLFVSKGPRPLYSTVWIFYTKMNMELYFCMHKLWQNRSMKRWDLHYHQWVPVFLHPWGYIQKHLQSNLFSFELTTIYRKYVVWLGVDCMITSDSVGWAPNISLIFPPHSVSWTRFGSRSPTRFVRGLLPSEADGTWWGTPNTLSYCLLIY